MELTAGVGTSGHTLGLLQDLRKGIGLRASRKAKAAAKGAPNEVMETYPSLAALGHSAPAITRRAAARAAINCISLDM